MEDTTLEDTTSDDMGVSKGNLTFTPPSKAWCPDMHWLVSQFEGTMLGVSVKLEMGQKGRLAKSSSSTSTSALSVTSHMSPNPSINSQEGEEW